MTYVDLVSYEISKSKSWSLGTEIPFLVLKHLRNKYLHWSHTINSLLFQKNKITKRGKTQFSTSCIGKYPVLSYCVSLLCVSFTTQHKTSLLTLLVFWSSNVCVCPHHNKKQVSDTKWVTYNLIQFWHYLPGDSLLFHMSAPPPPITHNSDPQSQVQVIS